MADSELLSPVRRSAAQSRALACGKAAGLTRQIRYLRPRRQARAQRRLPGGALACELSLASRLPRWHRRACPTSRSGHCRSCLVPVLGHSWSGPPHAGTLARHPAGTIVQPDGGTVAFEIAPVLLPGFRPGRPRHGASHLAYRRAHAWAIGGRMGSAKARDQVGRSVRTARQSPRQHVAPCNRRDISHSCRSAALVACCCGSIVPVVWPTPNTGLRQPHQRTAWTPPSPTSWIVV